METNDMLFDMINEQGETIHCEVLFSFQSTNSGKFIFVYTDNTYDEKGQLMVYATYFDPNRENQLTDPVEAEAEWDEILERFEEIEDGLLSEE